MGWGGLQRSRRPGLDHRLNEVVLGIPQLDQRRAAAAGPARPLESAQGLRLGRLQAPLCTHPWSNSGQIVVKRCAHCHRLALPTHQLSTGGQPVVNRSAANERNPVLKEHPPPPAPGRPAHTRAHTHTRTHTRTRARTHTRAHTHARTHARMHACAHTHNHKERVQARAYTVVKL